MQKKNEIPPVRVLKERAEARALLYRAGEFAFQEAVTPLLLYAEKHKIADSVAIAIIDEAFKIDNGE
jgi:hypothetical protein